MSSTPRVLIDAKKKSIARIEATGVKILPLPSGPGPLARLIRALIRPRSLERKRLIAAFPQVLADKTIRYQKQLRQYTQAVLKEQKNYMESVCSYGHRPVMFFERATPSEPYLNVYDARDRLTKPIDIDLTELQGREVQSSGKSPELAWNSPATIMTQVASAIEDKNQLRQWLHEIDQPLSAREQKQLETAGGNRRGKTKKLTKNLETALVNQVRDVVARTTVMGEDVEKVKLQDFLLTLLRIKIDQLKAKARVARSENVQAEFVAFLKYRFVNELKKDVLNALITNDKAMEAGASFNQLYRQIVEEDNDRSKGISPGPVRHDLTGAQLARACTEVPTIHLLGTKAAEDVPDKIRLNHKFWFVLKQRRKVKQELRTLLRLQAVAASGDSTELHNRRVDKLVWTLVEFMEQITGTARANIRAEIAEFVRAFINNPTVYSTAYLNFALLGPPGSGKSTVAKFLGRILVSLGILFKGTFNVESGATLIAPYVGQTAQKTFDALVAATEGVFFLDEAYSLTQSDSDYGQEAINEIVGYLDKHRGELSVIVAGYEAEMQKYWFGANVGMERRFPYQFILKPYSPEDLYTILIKQLSWQKPPRQIEEVLTPGAIGFLSTMVHNVPELWTNQAGDMETLAGKINKAFSGDEKQRPLSSDRLKELMAFILKRGEPKVAVEEKQPLEILGFRAWVDSVQCGEPTRPLEKVHPRPTETETLAALQTMLQQQQQPSASEEERKIRRKQRAR